MRFPSIFKSIALIGALSLSLGLAAPSARASDWRCEDLLQAKAIAAKQALSAQALDQAVRDHLMSVAEFRGLREICEKLGVRCWLFGGTAAGYAHYVKWDLLRDLGDTRYQKDRFDYDYTNIYRSTQDADLVIDGTDAQADEIESILKEKFQHFQGGKSVWEVRLLRSARANKVALLKNPDFLDQHTDSNSTGMIEVTLPEAGDPVVRDLRDWDVAPGSHPIFFRDVLEGKLHYYFSERHGETSRAKEGLNPPILSVIRYLTKAFQYELEISAEDRAVLQRIIDEYDPREVPRNSYVANWIERNGKKLFQHAVNIEYAWNQLESLGLRMKLRYGGNSHAVDSLAWWMEKAPLRSEPVGEGTGKTARELGIDIVAHETNSFVSYESITRAHTGEPNVFISRDGMPGEAAVHGNGFYTAIGRKGARGTGLTIRFRVHPDAREGSDFWVARHGWGGPEYVIFINKKALEVIPESLNLTPVQYFEVAMGGSGLESSDRALVEKLKRKLSHRMDQFTEAEASGILEIIRTSLERGHDGPNQDKLYVLRDHVICDAISLLRHFDSPAAIRGWEDVAIALLGLHGLVMPNQANRAAALVGNIGLKTDRVIEAIAGRIASRSPDSEGKTIAPRTHAIEAAKFLASDDPRVLRALIDALGDPETSVRNSALDALEAIGNRSLEVYEGILSFAVRESHGHQDYLVKAVKVLEGFPGNPWHVDHLDEVMGILERSEKTKISHVAQLLDGVEITKPEHLEKLFRLLDSPVDQFASAALRILMKIQTDRDGIFRQVVRRLHAKNPGTRIAVIWELEKVAQARPEKRDAIVEVLASVSLHDRQTRVRLEAAGELLKISPSDPRAIYTLLRIFEPIAGRVSDARGGVVGMNQAVVSHLTLHAAAFSTPGTEEKNFATKVDLYQGYSAQVINGPLEKLKTKYRRLWAEQYPKSLDQKFWDLIDPFSAF